MSETASREAVHNFLDYVGNHERKLGVAAVLLSEEKPIPLSQITSTVNDLQSEEPVWPIRSTITKKYLQTGLIPGGVAKKHGASLANTREYYGVNSAWHILPYLVGFEMQWSLDNPDLSVQQLLGSTSTRGQVRSPRVRFQLYGSVLAEPGQTISTISSHYERFGYTVPESVAMQINHLSNLGIFAVKASDTYNPTFQIVRRPASAATPPTPLTNRLHAFTETLPEGALIDLTTILRRLKAQDATIDLSKLRESIIRRTRHLGSTHSFAGMRTHEEPSVPANNAMQVYVAEEVATAVEEFCKNIERIIKGERHRPYKKVATLATDNASVTFRELLAKGKAFSARETAHSGNVSTKILTIMKNGGLYTAGDIQAILKNQHKQQVALLTVRRHLNELADDGVVITEQKPHGKTGKERLTNVYTLP